MRFGPRGIACTVYRWMAGWREVPDLPQEATGNAFRLARNRPLFAEWTGKRKARPVAGSAGGTEWPAPLAGGWAG